MGWTPRTGNGRAESDTGSASPAPRRRRRAAPSDTPNVDKAVARRPRASTGLKPEAGRNNQMPGGIENRDERPRDIRIRVGKRWSQILGDIKAGEYSWREFCEGLDEEELARGQLKADDGSFKGRPPAMVPREFHLACQREMKRRFEEIFSGEVLTMAKEYVKLARSSAIKDETKAKMMQYAMERVFGGIPKDLRVSQEQPWEQMVVNVMRDGNADMPDHLARRYAGYRERQGQGTEDE